MARTWRRAVGMAMWLAAGSALPAVTGCGSFFQCEGKASCGGSSGSANTGNVVFSANQASTGIYAFFVSGSQMYSVSGEPFSTGFSAQSMVVSRTNGYLYVSSNAGIYSYAVNSAGVLSNGTQQAITSYPQISMDVAPDGLWLVAIDSTLSTAPAVKIYQIGSSGALTLESEVVLGSVSNRTVTPAMVRFSPDNAFVAVAMGGNGDLVIPFNASSGALSSSVSYYIPPNTAQTGDNAVAWDSYNNLYIGRSTANTGAAGDTGVWVAPGTDFANGSTTYLGVGAALAAVTDAAPRSLVFANSNGLLYTANPSANTINGFSVTSTSSSVKLTSLGTSTTAPTTVEALSVDTTGGFLFAAGVSATDGLQMYAIGSGGALTAENTAPTGTATGYPVLAATH